MAEATAPTAGRPPRARQHPRPPTVAPPLCSRSRAGGRPRYGRRRGGRRCSRALPPPFPRRPPLPPAPPRYGGAARRTRPLAAPAQPRARRPPSPHAVPAHPAPLAAVAPSLPGRHPTRRSRRLAYVGRRRRRLAVSRRRAAAGGGGARHFPPSPAHSPVRRPPPLALPPRGCRTRPRHAADGPARGRGDGGGGGWARAPATPLPPRDLPRSRHGRTVVHHTRRLPAVRGAVAATAAAAWRGLPLPPTPCRLPFWDVRAGAAVVAAAAAATRAPPPVGRDERRRRGGGRGRRRVYIRAPVDPTAASPAPRSPLPRPPKHGAAPRRSRSLRAVPPPSAAARPCPRCHRLSAVDRARTSSLPPASFSLSRAPPLPTADGMGVAPPRSSLRRLRCPRPPPGWPLQGARR